MTTEKSYWAHPVYEDLSKGHKLGSGERFSKLKNKIAGRGDVDDPGAVAAAVGRKKYGKARFQKFAAHGKKSLDQGDITMDIDKGMTVSKFKTKYPHYRGKTPSKFHSVPVRMFSGLGRDTPAHWAAGKHPAQKKSKMSKAEVETLNKMLAGGMRTSAPSSRRRASAKAGMAGVSEAKAGQQFKPGQMTHEEAQATRGVASRMVHGAAQKVKTAASQVAAGARGMKPAFARSIECPHCGEGISSEFAVKALSIMAKSEGLDFDEELEDLIGDVAEDDVEKGGRKPKKGIGNKADDSRGPHKAGKVLHSARSKGTGKEVQRENTPKSPLTKSFPVVAPSTVRFVDYVNGNDELVAKSISEGTNHVPSARNMAMEHAAAQEEATE